MKGGGILLGGRSPERLDPMLRAAEASGLTYEHVGSTLAPSGGSRPLHRHELALGRGDRYFGRGAAGLRAWVCHAGIGAVVHPSEPAIAVGSTLLVVLRAGPVSVVVPNRIVGVIDEPDRFGFAYGTLDGHQERGEESFLVERLADGTVLAVVTIDATPATRTARIVGPAGRRLQSVAARRYLRSLRHYVEDRDG